LLICKTPCKRRVRRTALLALAGVALAGLLVAAATEPLLVEAVKSGNRDTVRALLASGADVNGREADGTTALHWAVRADDLDTTRLLIRAGANVNATNRYSLTPLSLAATNGNAAIAGALLEAGADANTVTPAGETVLMTASRTGSPEAVQLLLDHGADVAAREHGFDETALMWAAAENHPAVVRLLAGHGADLDAPARVLQFPNVKVDNATMVITALPRGGLTPLMYAARQGALESALTLADLGARLNLTDPDGMSAVVMAIINAHYDVAALLVDKGADPNVADVTGMAALYAAVDMHTLDPMVNRPPPRMTGSLDAVGLVKALLAHHADPNALLKAPLLARQHNFGDAALGAGATPLMRAAKNADVAMMDVLMAQGADPNRAMRNGMTPLLFAVTPGRRKQPRDTLAAVKVCLDHGADVNAAGDGGQTALHVAVGVSDELVKYLVARGARLDVKDQLGRTPLDVALGAGAGAAAGRGRGGRGTPSGAVRESTAALLRELAGAGPAGSPAPP
jgi:ankyrin repeat protein